MKEHVSEEQLILHYYGEPEEANESVQQHLDVCEECRVVYAGLQRVLNSIDLPVPEPAADFEQRVWERVAPSRLERLRSRWLQPQRWLPAAGVAVLVLIAFLAGRYSHPTVQPQTAQTAPGQMRQQILLVAVGDHLERSQMILAELMNSQTGAEVNIMPERSVAEALVNANRLYRQTAQQAGDTRVASLLDDLERVLVEIAHSPDTISAAQLDEFRDRIEKQGLLFKVRIIGSRIREQQDRPASDRDHSAAAEIL
jgi:hypothetical protein